jgi:Domain of unknown function (DUF4276)
MEDERRRRKADSVIEVIVVGEGLTEETFVRDVLAPELVQRNIRLRPRLIETSPGVRGGSLTRDRVLRFLRNTLRERGDTYVTTLFDLYGLRSDFPGVEVSRAEQDPLTRCGRIEETLNEGAVRVSQCRADRFFSHIQPHEFESLLFSDVSRFGDANGAWRSSVDELQHARDAVETPEHINDGPNTHPSARLKEVLHPRYDKVLYGSGIAILIGLPRIRAECRHFDAWLSKIESLKPLRTDTTRFG